MTDYEVGYGRPPIHTRFKKGVCPNPKGRGKRDSTEMVKTIRNVLSEEMEYREGRQVPIDFHIDVSRVFAKKREMLACHASQRNWLMRQHGMDEYLAIQEKWGGIAGAGIGVAQAEAYRQYRGHPYPQDNLLLELIGQDGRGKSAAAT